MIAHVHIVVSAEPRPIGGHWDPTHQGTALVALDDAAQVVHVCVGPPHGREEEDAPVAVLVDEDVVESAGVIRLADARHLTHGRGVR